MAKKKLNLPKERIFTGPASLVKRSLAFIIDIILISFIIYPLENILRNIIPNTASYKDAITVLNNPEYLTLITTVSILIAIVAVIYFSFLEYRLGQTVGKILTNIFVISDTKELKYWQCLVRALFLLPFIPFILLWVIDPLYIIFTKGNNRFSDILSKTKVIENYKM
ncbi:MAG: RDD family protein [Nanoarchaeota archaeon]